jgi:multisubunit Na+/H+ antiporter MnhC subunit
MNWRLKKPKIEPKKETLYLLLVDLLFVGFGAYLYYQEKQLNLILGLILLLCFSNYFLLSKGGRDKANEKAAIEQEFIQIFSYFSIYVRNHVPVYHALEECENFASIPMGDRLRRLLSAVDQDKSVRPFITFADEFSSNEIRQVMLSVYQMVDQGGNEAYLRQFSVLFDQLASNKQRENLKRQEDKLSTACMFPLLASGLTMVLVTVGVVVAIGGLINGL